MAKKCGLKVARLKKIFYLITELDPGGAEGALLRLAASLDRDRYEPIVADLRGQGAVADALRLANIEVIHFEMAGATDVDVIRRVANELRRRQPDILHTFLFHANIIGRIAARWAKIPRVISSVRIEEPRRSHLWLNRLTQRWCDYEVCVSESARRFTAERAGIAPEKLRVIPNGVDLRRFSWIVPPPAPSEWALPADRPLVVTVGRLDKQKDPRTFLQAAALTLKDHAARFAWAGDGPLRAQAEADARRLGIAGHFGFLGQLNDVRPLLARADVFCLASRWEGMPNAALEAMAARLPVVATAVGGVPEIVEEGRAGLLCPPKDPKALAERIKILLENKSLRAKMGEFGRARVEKDFSHDRVAALWQDLYAQLQ